MCNETGHSEFDDWLAEHRTLLFKVVYAYAFNHADRQDLFQEIALQVWRSRASFRGESSQTTWIYRVALNTALAWTHREDRHRHNKPLSDAVASMILESSPGVCDPRLEWLYRQISKLKEIDRSIALLLLDGCSYREISIVVGVSENSVGVKINRIKSFLAKMNEGSHDN